MSTVPSENEEIRARIAAREREEAQELEDEWESVEPGIYRYVGPKTPLAMS